jgi:hypothetical protein
MSVSFQTQTARNLVLSAKQQLNYGTALADASLTRSASVDASTMFNLGDKRWSDAGAIGHGTDFATGDLRTGYTSGGTVKGMNGIDLWTLGWMFALAFGQETVTGVAAPYTHLFTMPNISATMPCTTVYVEDTADIHRKYMDLAAKSMSVDIPERGPINASLDLVGTGRIVAGTLGTALPAIVAPNYLTGSAIGVTFTPSGGEAVAFAGRQTAVSFKIDRGSAPFESSGDGGYAASVQKGKLKFSVSITVMAQATDDIVGFFENFTQGSVEIGNVNAGDVYQLAITAPNARIKTKPMANVQDKVAYSVTFDEGSCLQVGNTPAISASLMNTCPAYLIGG